MHRWLCDLPGVRIALLAAVLAPDLARAAPAANGTAVPLTGPVELELVLPAGRPGTAEPLLTAGEPGRSDTIFVHYEAGGRIRLGWDSAVAGILYSAPLFVAGPGPHRLLVALGSLLPAAPAAPGAAVSADALLSGLLLLEFDGRTVLRAQGDFTHAAGPVSAVLGANRAGAAVVQPFFSGEILAVKPVPAALALAQAMQVGRWTVSLAGEKARYPGAVRLRVRFPATAAAADPLIVTGRTGAGDFLYAQVLDPHHLRFGFDHWAVGGMVSPPVEADLAVPHDLVLTMGALYAPDDAAAGPWRGEVAIWLDDRKVLSGPSAGHPTTPDEIILGYNLIGGSTAAAAFRGEILGAGTVTPAELEGLAR